MLRPGSIAKAISCAWAVICVLLSAVCCRAQQDQTPVFTLKVYANLVQVPTLVLGHDQRPLPRIDSSRFQVSLDSGKKFAPTRVRVEGEDPLDVSILLDMTGSQRQLIAGFAEAAEKMAAASLHPQDRVSVYALNCRLIRSARELAANPDVVKTAVDAALSAPTLNEGYSHGICHEQNSVWDAMARVVEEMKESPARRVMLVVSEGEMTKFIGWSDLHHYAAAQGVAIFGLNDGYASVYDPWRRDRDDPFRDLCNSTGGIVMVTQGRDLDKRLQQFISLLRNRYVVEFPDPQKIGAGMHSIQVSIKRDDMAFVTLAGVSVSLPDPKLTSDPHYLPSQAGADIPVGNRRPIEH